MKKQLLIVGVAALSFSAGAFALTGVQKITADLRPDIKLVQDGKYEVLKDASGNILYPLSYNGSTYLPIRSVATLAGKEVNWNSTTNTITLTSGNAPAAPAAGLPANGNAPAGTPSTANAGNYNTALTALETKINNVATEITNWSPSSNKAAEYNQLDAKIEALDYELSIFDDQIELDFNSSKLDATTYVTLDKKVNVLNSKIDTAENALDAKFYTANKPANAPAAPNVVSGATGNPVTPPAQTTTTPPASTSTNANIKKFQSRATALINEVNALKPASSYQARLNQYRALNIKIDTLDRDMDYYEDSIERDYRAGRLSYNSFIALDRELNRIENSIDHLDDTLEYKLGIDD